MKYDPEKWKLGMYINNNVKCQYCRVNSFSIVLHTLITVEWKFMFVFIIC